MLAHLIAGDVSVGGALKRRRPVQKILRPGDDARAPLRIVTAASGQIAHRIGAVERVIERPPTRIRRVQRVAGVHNRHDKLRAGGRRNLRVDILARHREVAAFGDKISDFPQEGLIGRRVDVAVVAVPLVDLRLKVLTLREQIAVARPKIMDQRRKPLPERIPVNPGSGQRLRVDEIGETTVDLKAFDSDALGHGRFLLFLLRADIGADW